MLLFKFWWFKLSPFKNNIYFKLTFFCLILPILKACHAENRPLSPSDLSPVPLCCMLKYLKMDWQVLEYRGTWQLRPKCNANCCQTSKVGFAIHISLSLSDIFYICGLEMWHNGMLPTLPLPTSHCHTPFPLYAPFNTRIVTWFQCIFCVCIDERSRGRGIWRTLEEERSTKSADVLMKL